MKGSHHLWPLFRFSGHFLSVAMVCPGFMAFPGTFSFCCDGLSWNCGVFRDISFPARRFVPVLWRFSGHFPFAWRFVLVLPPKQGCFAAAGRFSPGIVGFFRTFSFRGAFCPGLTAQTRMFCCCQKIFSWNCGVFRDISLLRCAVGINKYYFAFCMWFYYFCTAKFD